ncbi:class I SAM-dependent methyltransferase [Fructilactobacillus cliffordii]|uniref:class I SAM-dependent DNA methyltransferase n=1 Tax=Fructilactobacillus cliffordii TaxID=2940299 RepID=UPI002093A046|nr:class I SAM-dependent methyltransferase [Fructilactobacillus cliffordii]USS86738.1 class I SAM-dependent methyltransferase [Fructilactobacillus cliffordii]
MIYSQFATFYDQLFDNDLYPRWVNYLQKYVQPGANVLDLACGTGRLLVLLGQAGYTVTGVDLSSEMLALANQHAEAADLEIPLFQLNMLALDGLGEFDAVTCFDDSLCYLSDLDEVTQSFQQVAQHLVTGGQFCFDVITPYQTDVKYPGYMYNYQDEEQAFMWTTYAGEWPHSVEHDLTFFLYQADLDAYQSYSETHYERTYELEAYQQALQAAGFTNVTVRADFGEQPVTEQTTRWFFHGVKA